MRSLAGLAIVAIVATTVATLAALGARSSWLFELFAHFPLQYLGVLFLAGGICCVLRRWRWVALAVVGVIPNVLVVGPYLPGLFTAAASAGMWPDSTSQVSLVALNLRYTLQDAGATRAYLEGQSADILVLSEVTPRWQEKLVELEGRYPYSVIRPRWNPWGIALYSRFPLHDVEDLDLGDDRSSHLRVTVELPAGAVALYAVHLASPPSRGQSQQRNTQLHQLAQRIARDDSGLPVVVAGDLNITPYSPYFRDLLRDAGLRDARLPFGPHVTWPVLPVPIGIPIDHCLVSSQVVVTRVAIGPSTGSDHFPLECRFSPSS